METLQNLLTVAIEFVAIAGFGGIALHAIWFAHCRWMEIYCPKVQPVSAEEIMSKPIYQEEPAVEQVGEVEEEPIQLTFEDIDNNYRMPILQKLCTEHNINWKNNKGKGKGRHMTKGAMIQALLAAGVF